MQVSSEPVSLQKLRRSFLLPGAIAVLIAGGAHGQNLDQGKSAAKLFSDNCAACHHTARGLAKGRLSLTLFWLLRQHYTTDSSSAWALTSYLESVDRPKRDRSHAGAAKPAARASPSSPRPPAPVPGQ